LSATHQQFITSAIFNLCSYCPVITPKSALNSTFP